MLDDKSITNDVSKAIKDFQEASSKDNRLKEIYSKLTDSFEAFWDPGEDLEIEEIEKEKRNEKKGEISPIIKKANDSLRKAANRLSIAFRQSNNLLFLGDLEDKEIKQVIEQLRTTNGNYFDLIVSAHHGTHFHKSLLTIKSDLVLASVGSTLKRKLKSDYRLISSRFANTFDWGDIFVNKDLSLVKLPPQSVDGP